MKISGSRTKNPPLIHAESPFGFSLKLEILLDSSLKAPYLPGGWTAVKVALTLTIRLAKIEELPQILALLKLCIRHMDDKGMKQWPDWYPNEDIIIDDITKNALFVAEEAGEISAFVALSLCLLNYRDLYLHLLFRYTFFRKLQILVLI